MLIFIHVWLEALVKLFWNSEPNSDCIQVEIQQKQVQTKCSKDEGCRSSRTVHTEKVEEKKPEEQWLIFFKSQWCYKNRVRLLIMIQGQLGIENRGPCL